MKLIIDIPEEDYKEWIDNGEINALVVRDSLVNGTPFNSVIEDIKAEIDECYRQADDIAYAEGLEMAELIIDKHIGKEN